MEYWQPDLFGETKREPPRVSCLFDREAYFQRPHPPEWQEKEYKRALEFVRQSLPVILESLRTDEPFPWAPVSLRSLRIIFHNRSSWLEPEEREAYRQAFRSELARWEEAGELPEHEPIDPALLTRRTEPPALDCPAAEWEVAGISPIVDDETGRYGLMPLPLDQDTYVLWPGNFVPRTVAPPPPGEEVARKEDVRE